MYDFGLLLKKLRKERGLTQKALGRKLNVSETAICKYENNTATPPFETMRSLAAIFNVSLDVLFGRETPGTLSLYGLSGEQAQLLRDLAEEFRNQNTALQRNPSRYQLLGRVTEALLAK